MPHGTVTKKAHSMSLGSSKVIIKGKTRHREELNYISVDLPSHFEILVFGNKHRM